MDVPKENCSCAGNCHGHGSSWSSRSTVKVVALVVIGAIAIVSLLRDRIVNQPQAQVSVAGVGRVAYQADQATVTLGVEVDKVYDPASAHIFTFNGEKLLHRSKHHTTAING